MKDFIRLYDKNGVAKNKLIRKENIINVREVGLADYYMIEYKDNYESGTILTVLAISSILIIGVPLVIAYYCLCKMTKETSYILKDELK